MDNLLKEISKLFTADLDEDGHNVLVENFLNALEAGKIRCAQKIAGFWQVDERVKKGILLAFRIGKNEKISMGPLTFIDKSNLWPRQIDIDCKIRLVPGGVSIRRGAFLAENVVIMPPSYVNIGAYVDEGSLIDSNALVGSCAQVGKRVHISAGAQIGGVLEPIQAMPVIIEDDVLIGGNCGIFEGTQISRGAVIGAGVNLTKSTKVYDLIKKEIISIQEGKSLVIPQDAVVVPGCRALTGRFALENNLSVTTPLIIKYRDEKTLKKTELEDMLR
jgi:2,3,4,5-tetrahydropyridine-2,6-dicarboxylate N-succinyltransferase